MPVLLDAFALALLAAALVVLLTAGRGRPIAPGTPAAARAARRARWTAQLDTDPTGNAVVTVALTTRRGRTLQSLPVAAVAPHTPDWELQVAQSMMTARLRADVLNQERATRLDRRRDG